MNQEHTKQHESNNNNNNNDDKMTAAEGIQEDDENSAATSYGSNHSLGIGLEQTTTLSPLNDEPARETPIITNNKGNANVNVNSSSNSNNNANHRQQQQLLIACSQHTEVEFYSSGDEEGEAEFCDEYDDDGSSFYNSDDNNNNNDNNANNKGGTPSAGGTAPTRMLNRDTSRQSIQSVASDAFSLPVGAQDDVSSLECDQNHADDEDEFGVDDLSLKEAAEYDRELLYSSQHQQPQHGRQDHQQPHQHSKPLIEVDTSEMVKSPMVERTTIDMSRLHSLKEAFSSSKKMLHASLSTDMGLDHLPEAVNEDEDDDDDDEDDDEEEEEHKLKDGSEKNAKLKKNNVDKDKDNDDDEKSMEFDDLLQIPKLAGSKSDSSDEVQAVTARLHRSLFLPHGTSLLAYSPSTTPRARNRKQARHNSAYAGGGSSGGTGSPNSSPTTVHRNMSLQMIDDFGILAKNLPPELDLVEARKYIIQLAEGVPDTPTSKLGGGSGGDPIPPQSNAKSSLVESSEYTEEVLDEDDEDDGFDPRLPKTPPAGLSSGRNHQQQQQQAFRGASRESFFSYDFTEVVEDEIEEVEEEEEEEEFIEEEIIDDEEEAEEVVDEEDTEQKTTDASTNTALGVPASMVRATTT